MNLLQRAEYWGDTHHPKWLDIVRMALGVFLCYKGIEFLQNMGMLLSLVTSNSHFSFGDFSLMLIGHYIVFAHLLGGLFLALGLFTRFACLIQIPILLGAVIFVNAASNMWRPFGEFVLSLVILLLLIYFLIVGSGPWSVDRVMEQQENA